MSKPLQQRLIQLRQGQLRLIEGV